MRPPILFSACFMVAVATGISAVRADTLLLENGTRIEGRIVELTADGLVIEVGTERKQFPHDQIRFLRQTGASPAPAAGAVPVPTPAPAGAVAPTTQPVPVPGVVTPSTGVPVNIPPVVKGKMDPVLREKLLGEAFAAYQQHKQEKVILALSQLVRGCNEEELEWASLKCQQQETIGKPLAQILAEQRFNLAIEAGQGRTIKLTNSTEYEAAALSTLLAGLYNKLINVLKDYLNDPRMYQGDPKDAAELLPKAQLLAATITERLRIDASIVGEAKLELKNMQKNVDVLVTNMKLRSENRLTDAMKQAARNIPTATPAPAQAQATPTPTPRRGRTAATPTPRGRIAPPSTPNSN